MEIEGHSEKKIKDTAKKLGFDYSRAIFGSVDYQYAKKYNISLEQINAQTPRITFKMENPFLKQPAKGG